MVSEHSVDVKRDVIWTANLLNFTFSRFVNA